VVGFSAEEVAAALDLSLGSVNSALHRARRTVAVPRTEPPPEPRPAILAAYLRSWEAHDVDAIVALMRDDTVFAMPPHSTWYLGRPDVECFLRSPLFTERWSAGFRVLPTRANGQLALAFYRRSAADYRPSSLQLVRFVEGQLTEAISFIGPTHLNGFELPERIEQGQIGANHGGATSYRLAALASFAKARPRACSVRAASDKCRSRRRCSGWSGVHDGWS